MEYCTSQKGGKILFFEAYRYRKDRESEYSISWRCTEKNCRGRLLVTKNEMNKEPKSTTQHIHVPQVEKKEVNRFKEAIRITAASSSVLQPRQIIQANHASRYIRYICLVTKHREKLFKGFERKTFKKCWWWYRE
ncbi:hypothetical protein Zmor_001611 [Zophobas morio]|uniref:FLYWCH-type domain-containing protein n=1 Tax=Zophobas morio TaxID=2755281 RepID=A0AA38MSS5_9CUCU|nr:hypothetical protein Zmor_001611 [Zophobas morio]